MTALPLAASLGTVLIASWLLALPKSDGCGALLLRLAGILLGGSALVIALLMFRRDHPSDSVVGYLLLIPGLVAGTCATMLAATGWLNALGRTITSETTARGRGKKKTTETQNLEDRVDLTLMFLNPFGGSTSSSRDSDALDGCITSIVLAVVGALFWLGMNLAGWIRDHLLPARTDNPRNLPRAVLSLIYAAVITLGATGLLLALA